MASSEKKSAEEDASRVNVADLAINLADQLIDAFQQDTDGADVVGEAAQAVETVFVANGSADDGNTADSQVRDGEWQEMIPDEDDIEDEGEDGMKGEGVGEEGSVSCFSPIGSQGCATEDGGHDHDRAGISGDSSDVVFTPARVLNFDDSDGDDAPAVDQRYIPRGVFIQSDFMDDRPELHGSDEADMLVSNTRMNPLLVDQTQNVRIIEGHDDLDRGTAYMSMRLRNNFLQTHMIQLPLMTADDLHNHSANLYDSLEREDQEFFTEEDRRDFQEEDMEDDRESTNGEEVEPSTDAFRPLSDRQLIDENLDTFHSGGYVYAGQQYTGRGLPNLDVGEQGDGQAWTIEAPLPPQRSPPRSRHGPEDVSANRDPRLEVVTGDAGNGPPTNISQKAASSAAVSGAAAAVPSLSNSNTSLGQTSSDTADFKQSQEVQSARPKNMPGQQPVRGGPAGKGGRGAAAPHDTRQPCPRLSRTEQRIAGAGSQNAARNRVAVGSSGAGRHAVNGAQRPAVQGAAVVVAVSGDGDGAVADAAGAPAAPSGSAMPSRTSSQCSIHSIASNNSNSRVSGVGKESNSNRNMQRVSKTQLSKSADQFPATRGMQQHPQHSQQHAPIPQRAQQPASHSQSATGLAGPQAPGKRAAGAGLRAAENRASQLQQQRSQLQQEQQMLQQKQRQLQQRQQQQQQQQLVSGLESPDGDNLVHHQPDAVITQVGQLHQENRGQEQAGKSDMSMEVQGMEEVRSRLQNMLRIPREASAFDSRAFDFADSASELLMERPTHHFHDGDASSVSGYRGHEDMSEMFDGFSAFPHKMFSDMSSLSVKSDMSTHSENVYLRDCLEKERYRRKHCEQQIQSLNGKLLEIQQQLAVAVSTDKRKDIMIDQLDKQLAKVVEGWKKREADKDEYMRTVMKEKSQIEDTLHRQQAMIDSFESDLASTVEELKHERENSAATVDKMKAEVSAAVHDKRHAEEMLEAEKERVTLMEQDWEQLKESRDLAEKRAQQAQERLHAEQDNWYEREQELLHKIDQVKEANLKVMQMERVKLEEQTKKAEEAEEKVHTAETEVKRLEMEVDSANREKESLKVEMAITEAKFESAQRSLEADLHAQMEREISEQLNEVHEKMRAEQEEQAEKHRRTVSELHQRHQKDTEKQMAGLRQEHLRREEDLRQQIAELESRLSEYRQENSSLKQAKQKLESQRMEVLTKLQFIMQSQWNEAVSLLVSTPQRRNLNSSLASSLSLPPSSGPLLLDQQGDLTQSRGRHFSTTSAAAAEDALRGDSQLDRRRKLEEPASHNNLSDSSSRSLQSAQHSHQNIPVQSFSSRSAENGAGVHDVSPVPRSSGPANGPVITLEDISTLLSQGRQPSTSLTNSLHGVLHGRGVTAQTQVRDRQMQSHLQHSQQQEDRSVQSAAASSALSAPHAIMIRPPQQLSHPAGARDGAPTLLQFPEDFSFLSTSDISHDFSHLSQEGGGLHHGGGASDAESVRSLESRGLPQRFPTDRTLELQDLEVGSQGGLQNGWHGQNDSQHSDGGRSQDRGGHLPGGAGYSPSSRHQTMSPPVKQGRDGDHEADGGVLQETDRLNSSYREISRQLEEHQTRQRELQHYIRMLLEKPPHSTSDHPDQEGTLGSESLEISLETVDLDLTDAAQAAQLNIELHRLQQLRDRQATVPSQSARPKVTHRQPDPDHLQQPQAGGGAGAAAQPGSHLSPGQLAEISRLLGQYSEDVVAANPLAALTSDPATMTQLLTFLASIPQQPGSAGMGQRRGSGGSSKKNSPRGSRNSPKGHQPRRPHDTHRQKKPADVRSLSVGNDSSLSSSMMSDKHDRTMASSTKSTSSRKSDKKSTSVVSTTTASTSAKQSVRPLTKEKQPTAWK